LMQNDLNAENLTDELLKLLDPPTNQLARQQLAEVAHRLGEGGASERAAEAIIKSIDFKPDQY